MNAGYPSIDKPWLKYYSREAIEAPLPECTVWENVRAHNESYPDDVALLYFGREVTYRELFAQVETTACAMAAQGVGEGDNVALCMPAMPETIYAILALNRIGANAVLLNPTFTVDQLAERISEIGARLLLVANELWESVKTAVPRSGVRLVVACPATNALGLAARVFKRAKRVPDAVSWREFLRRGGGIAFDDATYLPDRPAVTVFSSGTTGASKGIQLSNGSVSAMVLQYEVAGFRMKRQDRYFAQVPIWFSTGIVVTMIVPLTLGITVMLEPIYDFKLFLRHISDFEPNYLVTAIGLLEYLMAEQSNSPAYSKFKYLAAGGEYVAPPAEVKFNSWLAQNGNLEGLHKGYGMCECGGTVTSTNSLCNEPGSSGIPLSHVVVAAFDLATGKELPYGVRGELRVLTPCRMLGYHGNPKATANFFKVDERGRSWACTGDMGYVSKSGSVFVSGRLSDSYVDSEGRMVYLFDVERKLLDHPAVHQCKAIAARVDGRETHVCHVVLDAAADASVVLAEAARSCAEDLPAGFEPKLFKLWLDALPVSPSGKLDVSLMAQATDELVSLEDGKGGSDA